MGAWNSLVQCCWVWDFIEVGGGGIWGEGVGEEVPSGSLVGPDTVPLLLCPSIP